MLPDNPCPVGPMQVQGKMRLLQIDGIMFGTYPSEYELHVPCYRVPHKKQEI